MCSTKDSKTANLYICKKIHKEENAINMPIAEDKLNIHDAVVTDLLISGFSLRTRGLMAAS